MNINELAPRFDRDGYLLIDDFFDAELMQRIDRRILSHFGDDPAFLHNDEFLEKAKTDVIPWFPQDEGSSDFDAVDSNIDLRDLTQALLGPGWRSLYCMVMFSKRESNGQAWHQDCSPDDGNRFNLNRLVYSSDVNDATGGQVVVVPGSHRRGMLPAGDPWEALDDQRVLSPRAGSLLILHGHAWHRVLPVNKHERYSTNYRAVPSGTDANVTDVCVYRNMRYRFSTAEVIEYRHA